MSSVFVRNLPYGVTQEELEQVFGDIGPVKKVDVIKDKGKKKSDMLTRGFAFVRYAIESDAQYAVEKLNGHEFQGRRMRLEIAREKGKKGQQQQQAPARAQEAPPASAAPVAAEAPAKREAEDFIALDTASDAVSEKPPKDKKKKKDKTKKKDEDEETAAPEPVVSEAPAKKDKKAKKEKKKAAHTAEDAEPPTAEAPAAAPKREPKVKDAAPKSADALLADGPNFAAAEPKVSADGHVQSDRNARRRMHREFLRQVEQRKNESAKPEEKSVVIYGLGADVTQKHIAKKVKKIGKAVSLELKEEAKTGKKFAVVQFDKLADVQVAIRKLDHHIFKGAMLKVKCLATAGASSASDHEGLRLIVRNLHFDTTDKDLETAFEVHGPLYEARVVRMPLDDPDNAAPDAVGRSRGFGFVQFRDIADARQAVEALNGVKVRGREMIVDFALAKSKYVEQQRTQKSMEVNPDDDDDDEDPHGEGHDDELEMASGDENDDDDGDDDDDEAEDDDDDEEQEAAPKVDTDAQRYRTIFIRNLSFQTTEDGLKAFFATFGAVEYARIVYDHGSGLSKGVGFVRFKDAAIADRVLARGQLAADREEAKKKKQSGKKSHKKENLFTLSALADGDALVLDGRMLSLTRAVAKEDADRLTTENSNERKKKDKRNMYLAYEGTINVNKLSEDELLLPKMDIEKRRRAIREKKEKLKNPMYFVSPVRLSVRNIGATVDDKRLKEIFRDGAIAGMREKNVDRSEVKLELLPKSDAVPVKVKMAKVVRDTDDVKPGKEPRSRGYGFVEFAEHVHALAALRKINNNPAFTHYAAGPKADKKGGALDEHERSRLIVEFALENHGKLKLREKRKQDAEKRREEERALREAQGESADVATEKKSRGQRQREAKKARALEKSAAATTDGAKAPAKKPKTDGVAVSSKAAPSNKRKRDAVDALAASLPTGSKTPSKAAKNAAKKLKTPSRKERKQAKELAIEESFDALVRNYKREIFGEKKPAAKGDDARERWFD